MNCCVCDSEDTVVFSTERIPCFHCNEDIEIVYSACNECGAIWKSVGGLVLECLTDNFPSEMGKAFDDAVASVQVIDLEPKKGNTMSEMIHHCIRCNALAYEIGTGFYKCPECDFEWEVL